MNTEHQLKWKLTWPVCPKSMKLKQRYKDGASPMLTVKNAVFIGFNLKIVA